MPSPFTGLDALPMTRPGSEEGTMRCSRCQHDNARGARSCARCGTTLSPVDLERVRAQLRRWQEHLLDLTKANPLLGINRSRVSKLRVVDPAPHALFGDFAVPDEATEILPRAVKVLRRDDEAPEDTGYRI